jgi:glycosyltransferase involved in cell wall biosynthesis
MSRALTVLQMLPALESGGVERGTLEVGRALVAAGHRSLVMSGGGRLVEQLEREGSEHHAWPIGTKSLWTLRQVRSLRRFLVDHAVDIVHARSRMPAWVAWLALRGMDPMRRSSFVTTVHGLYSVNRYSAIMTRGEAVIAVSDTVRDYILASYPETPGTRITVIHRGVDPAEFPHGHQPTPEWRATFEAQFPNTVGKTLLTLPGRLTRLKGHEDFIELMRRLKKRGLPVHGLIVGGATSNKQRYLSKLRMRIRGLDLRDDITLTGSRADLKDIMAISRVVYSLSTQPESFGRTTLEALCLGVPVLGYDHGGVGEILARIHPDGQVETGNVNLLEMKTRALLDAPPGVAENDAFALRDMLSKTLDLYARMRQ